MTALSTTETVAGVPTQNEVAEASGRPFEFYRLPFPNDLRITGGRINMSGHPSPGELLGIDVPDLAVAEHHELLGRQAFHMYGIIGSAVLTAALALRIIKTFRIRSIYGEQLDVPTKAMGRPGPGHLLGGTLFGLGWALVGACPGPIYALIGNGVSVMIIALLGALTGAWTYGLLQSRLPH